MTIIDRNIMLADALYYGVPDHTMDGLDMYINHKILPGDFLTAVLTNDLFGACARADAVNKKALPNIVTYIYNRLPSGCWGSTEIVNKWLQHD